MNCQACRIEIEEAADVRQALSVEARAHAQTCLPCRTFGDERLALRHLVGSLETVSAPPDFEFRLRARLLAAAGHEDNRRRAWQSFAPGLPSIALAASLALIIAAVVVFKNFTRTQTTRTNEAVATIPANGTKPERIVSTPPSIPSTNSPIEESPENQKDTARRNVMASSRQRESVEAFSRGREPVAGRNTTLASSGKQDITSIDYDVNKPGPQLYPTGIYNPAVDPNPPIIIPLRALIQPAKFMFDEGHGASHAFSLRAVSFGSEKLIEQNEDTLSLTQDATDIW